MASPDPALLKIWRLMALAVAVAVLLAGLGAELYWPGLQTLPVPRFASSGAAFVIAAALGLRFVSRRYHAISYDLRPFDLLIHRGVLFQRRHTIPRARIQHADIKQGPLERLFGVVTLNVHTAGSQAATGSVPGLLPDRAAALRADLLHGADETADG